MCVLIRVGTDLLRLIGDDYILQVSIKSIKPGALPHRGLSPGNNGTVNKAANTMSWIIWPEYINDLAVVLGSHVRRSWSVPC